MSKPTKKSIVIGVSKAFSTFLSAGFFSMLLLFSFNSHAQTGELGILNLSANGGMNPNTGAAWEIGDTYRLIFVTSGTRNAVSTVIGEYNAFAQAAANASTLNSMTNVDLSNGTWNVVASSETVNARTNTSTTGTDGEAIFLIDGSTIIATSYADFWDGHAVGTQDINRDENGNLVPDGQVWGGTQPGGGTVADRWLGTVIPSGPGPQLRVERGVTNPNTPGRWIQQFNNHPTSMLRLYALSDPLMICDGPYDYYVDVDGDGYPASTTPTSFNCDPGGDYVLAGALISTEIADCDDGVAEVFVGASCDDMVNQTVEDFINDNCECVGGRPIPTMSEWGIIVLSFVMLIFGIVAVRQRKTIFG